MNTSHWEAIRQLGAITEDAPGALRALRARDQGETGVKPTTGAT